MSQLLRDLKALTQGISSYQKTGDTPESAHQALINLYCRTRGVSNDLLHNLIRLKHPPVKLPPPNGVLGNLSASEVAAIADEVREKGYYIAPTKLAPERVARLTAFSVNTPCRLTPIPASGETVGLYDPQNPKAVIYDVDPQALVNEALIQELFTDPSMLAVAQSYLASEPIISQMNMRWSTPLPKTPSDDAAQLYHFDMERVKWIRFFFYLTDVTPETGPHCFVARTHKANVQPPELLKRGYARITDEEMLKFFPKEDLKEFNGSAGTIMVLDTRAYHKGKMPTEGDRLLLEFTFTDSLFGAKLVPTQLTQMHSPALPQLIRDHPRMYARYRP